MEKETDHQNGFSNLKFEPIIAMEPKTPEQVLGPTGWSWHYKYGRKKPDPSVPFLFASVLRLFAAKIPKVVAF